MDYPLDKMVVTFSRPVVIDGKEVAEIEMMEPTLRDRILYDKDKDGCEVEQEARMIARLVNVESEKSLYGLPACDYKQLQDAFNQMVKAPAARKQS